MSTAHALSQRRQSKLPLALQRHHLFFALSLTSIVVLGTAYSIVFGTHLQNVRISSGVLGSSDLRFPATLPGAAVAPASIQNSGDGNPIFGPIPPTILLSPHHALNYWANRKNIMNRIFVKKAWLWTTVAWLLQLLFVRRAPSSTVPSHPAKPRASPQVASRVDYKKDDDSTVQTAAPTTITSPVSISVLRYLVATSMWLLFANWFFGPPLSERILTATGAVCVPSNNPSLSPVDDLYCRTRTPLSSSSHPALFSSTSSNTIRAMWKGGHDISGHTFIMVLSSLLLLEEVTPYLWVLFSTQASVGGVGTNQTLIAKVAVLVTLLVVGLWSWMLLNTAIYFHTPQEKFSGLLVGLVAWLFLPKGN